MKQTLLFVVLTLLLACKKSPTEEKTFLQEPNKDSLYIAEKRKQYQPIVDSIISQYNFNGSIRIGWKDQLIYTKHNGYSNFEKEQKISDSTTYAIASISKQFTAVLILGLEQKKKLNLDDAVGLYLEDFKNGEKKNITIKQLLNHTSGIVDYSKNLASKPGEHFNYSNKGYHYLQQIIEKVTGKSMAESLNLLCKELKLNNTHAAGSLNDSLFASAYIGTLSKPSEVSNMPQRLLDASISLGAGGVISNPEDLQKWNYLLYHGKIIAYSKLLHFIKKYSDRPHPILGTMGYGLGIMMNLKNPQAFFHSGYVKGAPSLNLYYPKSEISVIILSNFANENLGKKANFRPHLQLKQKADSIEAI